jgi:hypothetical protein
MIVRKALVLLAVFILGSTLVVSCSKEGEKADEEIASKEEETISYIAEDVSFGLYFDEECTKRTLKLGKNEREFKVRMMVHLPDDMEISAVEYRLVLPAGVEIESDKIHVTRNMLIGYYDHGISENFHCEKGPGILLHTWTLETERELKNAEITVLASKKSNFLGVARCEEGHPMVRATSYKAVINPVE